MHDYLAYKFLLQFFSKILHFKIEHFLTFSAGLYCCCYKIQILTLFFATCLQAHFYERLSYISFSNHTRIVVKIAFMHSQSAFEPLFSSHHTTQILVKNDGTPQCNRSRVSQNPNETFQSSKICNVQCNTYFKYLITLYRMFQLKIVQGCSWQSVIFEFNIMAFLQTLHMNMIHHFAQK